MKYILICGDTNDGDYIDSINKIDDGTFESIKPLIQAIKDFQPYTVKTNNSYATDWTHKSNFPNSEYNREDLGEKSAQELYKDIVSEDVFETFIELIPHGEHGIHTIKEIKILEVSSCSSLLETP